MNKAKIINDILLEYSLLVEDGGISKVDADKLLTAIEKWRWMIIGGSAVIGFLASHLL